MYTGEHGLIRRPAERYIYPDPLYVMTASHLLVNIQEWEEDPDWEPEFEFAPDENSKANFSGGGQSINLPDEGADPLLMGVRKRPGITLVQYLRTSFAWGGFPGFEFESEVPASLSELQADLLPI